MNIEVKQANFIFQWKNIFGFHQKYYGFLPCSPVPVSETLGSIFHPDYFARYYRIPV